MAGPDLPPRARRALRAGHGAPAAPERGPRGLRPLPVDRGAAYWRYPETINAVASFCREARRLLSAAWDVAFTWRGLEPPEHRVACPESLMAALAALMLLWGWPVAALHVLLGWHGIMRPIEHLAAARSQLVLPADLLQEEGPAYLRIPFPKTRRCGPRRQTAKVTDPFTVSLASALVAGIPSNAALWPQGPGTFRPRFAAACARLGLRPSGPGQPQPHGLSPGSLRPGGATALLASCGSSEEVRRRGRWVDNKTMEIYLQELDCAVYLAAQTTSCRQAVLCLSRGLPEIGAQAISFLRAGIPARSWPTLWSPPCPSKRPTPT